ncbi:MAG: nucleotidyltransferase domain-containing protein [Micromonosporaceae bacterium]
MDMSHPVTAVIPSLDGPVLETLAGTTRPLSGRQVHRLCGVGSEAGVRNVLNRLVAHGLVDVTEAGGTHLYVLNREHLAAPAVESLSQLRAALIERLRGEVSAWRLAPAQASLFGSTARGDGDVHSDVDLLLVRADQTAEDDELWQEQVSLLAEHVRRWTGNHAQIYDIDESGLSDHIRASEEIVQDWRRDAITLTGEELSQLIRRTGAVQ